MKETTSWLNRHGYRTRRGSTFGVGPVHKILTNTCYSTGKWPYGKRDSRNGGQHDPEKVILIPVPVLIDTVTAERVLAKLARNNPRTTPPRVVNGPSLLTGIAICASCGSGMTGTGTNRRGKSYSYYSCAGCHQKGTSVCKGRHIPASMLDDIVLSNLKQRLFTPKRLAWVCKCWRIGSLPRPTLSIVGCFPCSARLPTPTNACGGSTARSKRVSSSSMDILRERVAALKSDRERAKAAYDRARAQCGAVATIEAAKIDAFARLISEKLDNGDSNARKGFIRSIVDAIEVDDKQIRFIGSKNVLQAAIAGKETANENVRGFVSKWRARKDSNL